MSTLTAGADLAWKLAAAEAAALGHSRIENAQLFAGVLSLEKAEDAPSEVALAPEVRRAVEDEGRRIREVLERSGLEVVSLRRLLREHAGHPGRSRNGAPDPPGGLASRSPACRETFYRAAMLSGPGGVSALDLLAALAGASDLALARAVREAGGTLERLREEARSAVRAGRAGGAPGGGAPEPAPQGATPRLDRCGRDLTALAARGELGPVVGRRAEQIQVLQTLARAGKSNPVLVGEPGVGKTAIVEALAQRATQGKDPAVLGGRRVVELRLATLLAGTMHRIVLEERVAQVLAEMRARPEVIVFIDELHEAVGAVETETETEAGRVAADFLKRALAGEGSRLIGATTVAGYRRHIASDPALARHFEPVVVNEPSPEEALEILEGLRSRFEARHRVQIEDAALSAAVDLSVRFDPDHCLPDKAIDLVDRAAARGPVTEASVAQVLAEKAQLPVEVVAAGLPGTTRPPVLELEAYLRDRLVGQDEALARVARRLRIAHAGNHESERALAALLLVGSPGIGKTETARLLASFLFGTDKALHRFDLSEYSDEDGAARLMGSPSGAGAHAEEGRLVARLRTVPAAVVLLDELEKAHPSVLEVLRRVFDAGRLTDGRGRTADARHAVFILTSNLGSGEAARRVFPPELLERMDEIIAFRALGPEDAVRILRTRLRVLRDTVQQQHGAALEVEPEAEAFIARAGFDPSRGVHELRGAMQRLVEAPLSSLILDGKIKKHPAWRVAYDEGGIYVVPGA